MKSSLAIPFAIMCGGIIIAVAVYVSMPKTPTTNGSNPSLVRPVGASDHILGNPAAKVMIIEYTDFDCEYCKGFHDTLQHIVANAGVSGRVAWVLRQFPLSEIHPNALALAKASECAGEVGGNEAFWRFVTTLYQNQPVAPAEIGTVADKAGISGDAFATCYASESASAPLIERIMKDRQNALDMGAPGTPFSIILVDGKNPIVMDGAYPYDAVKQLIDQALGN